MLILQRQGNLRLRRQGFRFGNDLVSGADDRRLILLHHRVRGFLIRKQHVGAESVVLDPLLHHFRGVVRYLTAGVLNAELIIQVPAGSQRIIVGIIGFLVADFLQGCILRGIDAETARVQKRIRLCLRIALFDEICQHLVRQRIDEVRVHLLVFRIGVDHLNAAVDVIRHGFIVLVLCDELVLEHLVQDLFTAGSVFLRIDNGVVTGRILGDAGNDGVLGQVQVTDGFVEIPERCRLHAERVVAEVDGVEVVEQDVVLAHRLLQLDGEVLLLNLAADALEFRLLRPAGENVVLDQLLRDRRGALGEFPGGKAKIRRAENTLDIDAVVLVEALVLDGDERVLQVLRDHVQRDRNPVGVGRYQLRRLIAVTVIYERRISPRRHVNVGDIRCRVQHAAERPEAKAHSEHKRPHQCKKNDITKRQSELGPSLRPA